MSDLRFLNFIAQGVLITSALFMANKAASSGVMSFGQIAVSVSFILAAGFVGLNRGQIVTFAQPSKSRNRNGGKHGLRGLWFWSRKK